MNKNQVKGSASEEKGKVNEVPDKVVDSKSLDHKSKAEKHGGKDGAV